jgi:hypothetical protein
MSINTISVLNDNRRGLDWILNLLEHFTTRLGTRNNYSAIANLHTLQLTTEHDKFSACSVFSSRSLVTASNNGDS